VSEVTVQKATLTRSLEHFWLARRCPGSIFLASHLCLPLSGQIVRGGQGNGQGGTRAQVPVEGVLVRQRVLHYDRGQTWSPLVTYRVVVQNGHGFPVQRYSEGVPRVAVLELEDHPHEVVRGAAREGGRLPAIFQEEPQRPHFNNSSAEACKER